MHWRVRIDIVNTYVGTDHLSVFLIMMLDPGWSFMKDPTGNGHDATVVFADMDTLTISSITIKSGGSSITATTDPTQ